VKRNRVNWYIGPIVTAVNSHEALVSALKSIAAWRQVNIAGEYEHSLRDIIRAVTDCAAAALDSIPTDQQNPKGKR
jgi:hypothetical protein